MRLTEQGNRLKMAWRQKDMSRMTLKSMGFATEWIVMYAGKHRFEIEHKLRPKHWPYRDALETEKWKYQVGN